MIVTVLFSCFALSLILLVYLGTRGRLYLLYAQPIYVFLLGMAFVYGIMPVLKELSGVQTYPFQYALAAKLTTLVYLIIFTGAAVLAYTLLGGFSARNFPALRPLTRRERRRILLLIGVPAILALAFLVYRFVGEDLALYMKDRIAARRGLGPIVVLSFCAILYVAISLLDYLLQRRSGCRGGTARLWLILTITAAICLLTLLLGNRNFVFNLIGILLIAMLGIFRIKVRGLFVIAPLLLTVALVFSGWAKIRMNLDDPSASGSMNGRVSDLLVYGLNGGFGNVENLYFLVDREHAWQPLYGKTVLAALVNPVPRAIWQDKPYGGGPELRNMIAPGSYSLDGRFLTSYTTGLPAEGLMNFRSWGPLLFGLVLGAILAGLRALYARQRLVTPLAVVFYSYSVFVFGFGLLYMELLGGWSRYFIAGILVQSVLWLGDRRVVMRRPVVQGSLQL